MGARRAPVRDAGRPLAVRGPRRRDDVPQHRSGPVQLPVRFHQRPDEPVARPAPGGRDQAVREHGQRRPGHQEARLDAAGRLVRDVQRPGAGAVRADRQRRPGHQQLRTAQWPDVHGLQSRRVRRRV